MITILGILFATLIAVVLSYATYGFTMMMAFTTDLTIFHFLAMLIVIALIWWGWWTVIGVHVSIAPA